MPTVKSILLGLVLLLGFSAPSLCQSISTDQPQRGYVAVDAGAILRSPTKPVFAAEYGENMGQHALAYVNLAYYDNIIRPTTADALTSLGTGLTATTGSTFQFSGRDRGVAVTGGGKYLPKKTGVLRPYIGGGAGIISLRRTISERRLGNVTDAIFNDYGIGEADLTGPDSVTKPLGEIVGGIGFAAGPTYIEAGYRYRRVFGLDKYDFSQLTAGIGYRW